MKNELTETKPQNLKPQYPTVTPTVYVNENKDAYEITFEMPGVGRDDVTLHVENRTLTLSTDTKFTEPEGFACECREFPVCNYAVSLDLPEHADTAEVKATVANGVLAVKLQKRAELKPRKIDVSIE